MPQIDSRAKTISSSLTRLGLSRRWLASQLGTTHHSIAAWLQGESKPRNREVWDKMLAAIDEYEREPVGRQLEDVARQCGTRRISIFRGQTGMPSVTASSQVSFVDVLDWGTPSQRWGRIVDSFSMEPELNPGDIVLFEDREWQPGHIVQASFGVETCVATIRGEGDERRFVPANKDYPVIHAHQWSIDGVVVERWEFLGGGVIRRTEFAHGMRSAVDRPILTAPPA